MDWTFASTTTAVKMWLGESLAPVSRSAHHVTGCQAASALSYRFRFGTCRILCRFFVLVLTFCRLRPQNLSFRVNKAIALTIRASTMATARGVKRSALTIGIFLSAAAHVILRCGVERVSLQIVLRAQGTTQPFAGWHTSRSTSSA